MPAIELDNVSKAYRTKDRVQVAVRNLSLQVPEGSIYGFIGPNGSGKSTTLRMILQIILPDEGTIRVLGEPARAADDRIGFLPEERGLYKKMKLRDVLCFFANLKGSARPGALVDEWLERLDLAKHAGKKIEELSKGMGQKAQFIAAVVAKPRLAILDEPFSGLDPKNRDVLRDALLELHRQGTTVIFSTHDMAAAEQLCDRVFMIYRGDKVLDGTLADIRRDHAANAWRLGFDGADAAGLAPQLPGVEAWTNEGNTVQVALRPGTDGQTLLAAASQAGRVSKFERANTLHDVFLRLAEVGDEALDGAGAAAKE
jgi:ABC-2 type transport system ATP-binding protein